MVRNTPLLKSASDRMLNGVLKLDDMEDVEDFAHIHARAYLRRHNIRLLPHDYEDLISFIISLVWELYVKKWNRENSFSGYAGHITQRRITDFFRERWGRNKEKIPINQATSISELGELESQSNPYDKADSYTALRGVLIR